MLRQKQQSENMNSPVCDQETFSVNTENPVTVQIADRLFARLYEDTYPHCMETATLQKGLILVLDREKLIEEGLGFGAPVAKYKDKTYFSSSAEISIKKTPPCYRLSKKYLLDTVSRKKFWRATYINDSLYSSLRKTFEKEYLSKKNLSPFFNAIMELRQFARIKTEFLKVKARGAITVTYDIKPSLIDVSVDFSDLELNGCEEVLVLNEQGSTFFEEYVDANGLKLWGREIGAWDLIRAEEASLMFPRKQLAFSLQKVRGATLFRGWERTRNRFSWAGLSYSLRPTHGNFDYAIRLNYAGVSGNRVNLV